MILLLACLDALMAAEGAMDSMKVQQIMNCLMKQETLLLLLILPGRKVSRAALARLLLCF